MTGPTLAPGLLTSYKYQIAIDYTQWPKIVGLTLSEILLSSNWTINLHLTSGQLSVDLRSPILALH